MRKIIDSFLWYNEVDLLKMRLYEVGDIVDHFLLVESTHTHSGKPRDLLFPACIDDTIVKKYLDKIEHCVIDDFPYKAPTGSGGQAWNNEYHHRRAISKFIAKFDDNDIFIMSDGDELIKRSVMQELRDTLNEGTIYDMLPIGVGQTMYSCTFKNPVGGWMGPKVATVGYCKNHDLQDFRTVACTSVLEGGWHLTNFGGVEKIKEKLQSYSHQEFNRPDIMNNLERRIKENKDILGRQQGEAPKEDKQMQWDQMPQMVQDNKEEYK